jgi:hypothetical protein
MGDRFEISFDRMTGLLVISKDGQVIDLTLEDLNEIQEARGLIGDEKIVSVKD